MVTHCPSAGQVVIVSLSPHQHPHHLRPRPETWDNGRSCTPCPSGTTPQGCGTPLAFLTCEDSVGRTRERRPHMPSSTTDVEYIRWFADLGLDDIPLVGGKNASLGELPRALAGVGVRVPPGFGLTADAYRVFLHEAHLDEQIPILLQDLNTHDLANLRQRGRQGRQAILAAPLPGALEVAILEAYERLSADSHADAVDVAVR